ncbi:MAG TPA: MerR family transcriptional regulator [Micromonosporaceae bacterium]
MTETGWTLDELAARVAAMLDGHAGAAGAADRRVRQVPDRRAIRWYTTIGLLDRPQVRGRTGWYGERHLLQLVAIKRLQAAGRSLAEIQADLAGATDATLRRIAALPGGPVRPPPPPHSPAEPPARFWTRPVTGSGLRIAIDLADGVTLLLTPAAGRTVPGLEALSAVHAAARPLLDTLTGHGLLSGTSDPRDAEGETP